MVHYKTKDKSDLSKIFVEINPLWMYGILVGNIYLLGY